MPKFKLPPRLPFRNLGVAGLGLIGGSIAKALMPFDGLSISAFDGDPETVREARKIRRFSKITGDVEEFLSWPLDLAYLCLPVRRNVELIERMGAMGKTWAVTDSGSTKGPANEAALAAGLNYCGGHPIAGKEVAGFRHSQADLVRGCLYILTPDERFGPSQKELLWRLNNLHKLLGCRVKILTPFEHDRIYGLISHLTYVSASAMAGTAMARGRGDILDWAGTGFRDTTRVGASPPAKWVEVAMENSENLVEYIGHLIETLDSFRSVIGRKDAPELMRMLEEISAFRRRLDPK
jgi:prephenate dehydrogenase